MNVLLCAYLGILPLNLELAVDVRGGVLCAIPEAHAGNVQELVVNWISRVGDEEK
jgi:hypothetical protein